MNDTCAPFFTEEDWTRIERDWTAWWNHDLSRPMLMGGEIVPRDRKLPDWWSWMYGGIPFDIPVEDIASEVWDIVSNIRCLGDSWPRTWVNFGAGTGAAFLGGEGAPDFNTIWFTPGKWEGKSLREIQPEFDPENSWWRRVQDLTKALVDKFDGRAQVGFTDIGGNMDIVASLRGSEAVLMDTIDDPEGIGELCATITRLWLQYFEEQCSLILPVGRGTSSWSPLWSPKRTYMLQSDISYMISPADFERWVAPDLNECCSKMEHGFYHLDGKGQLPHLDILLSIPELRGIQWIPGDGQPSSSDPIWWPIYKRIRDAGKLVQIFSKWRGALKMAEEIPLTGFAIDVSGEEGIDLSDLLEEMQKKNASVRDW